MLIKKHFEINESLFDAYFDETSNLIFVLDNTQDARKPNVLLVMDPVGNRKWDDILSKDYDVDLKTIRPKKDNKFQKLDIEYSGLVVYSKLIKDFEEGNDLETAIAGLSAFRDLSVRRSAADRIAASAEIILKTQETVNKTEETIEQVKEKITTLKEKRSAQKKQVGREPTKQSAAKILKTESQIETAVAKLKRSNKRLKNAQRRIQIAEDDIKAAQTILKSKEYFEMLHDKIPNNNLNDSNDDLNQNDVKPIIEKDPEIMDDSIAFKPVDFDGENQNNSDENEFPAPTSDDEFNVFENPMDDEKQEENIFASSEQPIDDEKEEESPFGASDFKPISFDDDWADTKSDEPKNDFDDAPVFETEPVKPLTPSLDDDFDATPVAPVTPLSNEEIARPTSPLTGVAPVNNITEHHHHKGPSALYYIALFILIGLSIFTLWLYKNNSTTGLPSLLGKEPTIVVVETVDTTVPVQIVDTDKTIGTTSQIQIVQSEEEYRQRQMQAQKPVQVVETVITETIQQEPVPQPAQVVETVITESVKTPYGSEKVVEKITITETVQPEPIQQPTQVIETTITETVQPDYVQQPTQVVETVRVTETVQPAVQPVSQPAVVEKIIIKETVQPEVVQVVEVIEKPVEVTNIIDPVQIALETGRPVQVIVPVHPGELMGEGYVDIDQEAEKIQESIKSQYQASQPIVPIEKEEIITTIETEEYYYSEQEESSNGAVLVNEPETRIDTAEAVRQMETGVRRPSQEYNVSGGEPEMIQSVTSHEFTTEEETY